MLLKNGNLGLTAEVTLRLFTYTELKRATNGFKEELGKGSFGAVYKGALNKGKKLVAVKRLEKLVEEGERFPCRDASNWKNPSQELGSFVGFLC